MPSSEVQHRSHQVKPVPTVLSYSPVNGSLPRRLSKAPSVHFSRRPNSVTKRMCSILTFTFLTAAVQLATSWWIPYPVVNGFNHYGSSPMAYLGYDPYAYGLYPNIPVANSHNLGRQSSDWEEASKNPISYLKSIVQARKSGTTSKVGSAQSLPPPKIASRASTSKRTTSKKTSNALDALKELDQLRNVLKKAPKQAEEAQQVREPEDKNHSKQQFGQDSGQTLPDEKGSEIPYPSYPETLEENQYEPDNTKQHSLGQRNPHEPVEKRNPFQPTRQQQYLPEEYQQKDQRNGPAHHQQQQSHQKELLEHQKRNPQDSFGPFQQQQHPTGQFQQNQHQRPPGVQHGIQQQQQQQQQSQGNLHAQFDPHTPGFNQQYIQTQPSFPHHRSPNEQNGLNQYQQHHSSNPYQEQQQQQQFPGQFQGQNPSNNEALFQEQQQQFTGQHFHQQQLPGPQFQQQQFAGQDFKQKFPGQEFNQQLPGPDFQLQQFPGHDVKVKIPGQGFSQQQISGHDFQQQQLPGQDFKQKFPRQEFNQQQIIGQQFQHQFGGQDFKQKFPGQEFNQQQINGPEFQQQQQFVEQDLKQKFPGQEFNHQPAEQEFQLQQFPGQDVKIKFPGQEIDQQQFAGQEFQQQSEQELHQQQFSGQYFNQQPPAFSTQDTSGQRVPHPDPLIQSQQQQQEFGHHHIPAPGPPNQNNVERPADNLQGYQLNHQRPGMTFLNTIRDQQKGFAAMPMQSNQYQLGPNEIPNGPPSHLPQLQGHEFPGAQQQQQQIPGASTDQKHQRFPPGFLFQNHHHHLFQPNRGFPNREGQHDLQNAPNTAEALPSMEGYNDKEMYPVIQPPHLLGNAEVTMDDVVGSFMSRIPIFLL